MLSQRGALDFKVIPRVLSYDQNIDAETTYIVTILEHHRLQELSISGDFDSFSGVN